jgi:hypothetical protein
MPLYAKIDVTKIDKARLFKGKKGVYLDLVIIETPTSKYGTHIIKQSAPKGTEMPILGNVELPRTKDTPQRMSKEQVHKGLQGALPPQTEDVPF